jgi:single-strand DNA-binding protein
VANETTLTITGNLTAEPELRFTPSGAALVRFTVASTPRIYDQKTNAWRDGEPLFMTCSAWRDMAENIAESLSKGARVVVTGKLRLSRWEDKETGEKRQQHQLDVEDIGASLRYAQAKVRKLTRQSAPGTSPNGSGAAPADDPWATNGQDTEPPF